PHADQAEGEEKGARTEENLAAQAVGAAAVAVHVEAPTQSTCRLDAAFTPRFRCAPTSVSSADTDTLAGTYIGRPPPEARCHASSTVVPLARARRLLLRDACNQAAPARCPPDPLR